MAQTEPRIRFSFEVSEKQILNGGVSNVLERLRMTADGRIVVPIDIGGGLVMGNPAPCGTWERVESNG